MRSEFRRAIEAARQHDEPDGRIAVIKQAVKNEVSSADPAVRVRFTDYFNHTLAPDLVLQWPDEGRERFLFVRPTAHAGRLMNDIPFVASHHPLVFILEDLGETEGGRAATPRKSLNAAAAAADTWITDSNGTEAIAEVRTRSPLLGMLSQALVRGGRGVSGGQDVQQLVRATERGFAGASKGTARPARSAVKAIEGQLDSEQAGRLTRFLRAVWEGHGSDTASFPTTSSVGKLTADDLSYLLGITSEGSPDFWARIGRSVSTELLGHLRIEDPSPNLQALVSASLDELQAKGVRVVDEPYRLAETEDFPRWVISRECLALRGLNWTAYIAARRVEEFPSPDDTSEMPDLRTVRRRASAYRTRISEVQFKGADSATTYESTQGGEVLDRQELSRIEAGLEDAHVHKARAVLPDGGSVAVDFPTRTAYGPANVTFLLRPLMRFALPLLSDFSGSELEDLQRVLQGDAQEELFPDLPGYSVQS